ncbi:MAG: gliding motility-associated C-terminal domain-containing protein, partial [Flavobacteriaceae bacterium]|nr:gliding motility-associated C-terminal domain-containing protein [Flavobacteriaceae bacterium]
DADDDGDGVLDSEEAVCGSDPLDADDTPVDTDRDGNPDCIDSDDDGDGVLDAEDEFPLDGTEWADADGDGIGNNADTDDDNDGFSDVDEIAVGTDPLDANDVPADGDGDGIPDALDNDLDNDGVTNDKDAFPLDATETIDTDGDGIGDNADMDDDNDGISDSDEVASGTNPKDANSKPRDLDGDGIPDALDADIDGDGVPNAQDAFPYDRTESVDTDGDGLGNNLDPDDDNDGVLDGNDANPLSANSGKDTDGDGVADEQDNDVDNDGFADNLGEISGFLSPQTSGIESKWVVANIKQYPLSRVAIYDRNGNEVFSAVNYQNDWDGTYKDTGKRVPAGSYLYRITLVDGTKAKEGWIYIIY